MTKTFGTRKKKKKRLACLLFLPVIDPFYLNYILLSVRNARFSPRGKKLRSQLRPGASYDVYVVSVRVAVIMILFILWLP